MHEPTRVEPALIERELTPGRAAEAYLAARRLVVKWNELVGQDLYLPPDFDSHGGK